MAGLAVVVDLIMEAEVAAGAEPPQFLTEIFRLLPDKLFRLQWEILLSSVL